jgi:hypothetical protein
VFEAAQKACARYQPEQRRLNLSPAQVAERRDRVLKFAKCMREHGIDVPSPETSSSGAVRVRIAGTLNPESPKFQAAQRACQSLFPFKKGPRGPSTQTSGGGPGAAVGIGP